MQESVTMRLTAGKNNTLAIIIKKWLEREHTIIGGQEMKEVVTRVLTMECREEDVCFEERLAGELERTEKMCKVRRHGEGRSEGSSLEEETRLRLHAPGFHLHQ